MTSEYQILKLRFEEPEQNQKTEKQKKIIFKKTSKIMQGAPSVAAPVVDFMEEEVGLEGTFLKS